VLPHRAAGANSAIEDAEALGHYLRSVSGSAPHVHTALQHVMRVRFRRASRFQALSHDEGLQGGEKHSRSIVQEGSYPGAARWEIERPDMVLKEGEPIIYVLDE
jgi:2-polyprenyl-6-methoxyphenol hydroxylase-like FAD-dependent oxidoreductase